MKFTIEQKEIIKHEIELEVARRDYADYCKYVHRGRWILGKHLELVCHKIEGLIFRKITQNILIISMPPQHGKSQCVTETLPSYYLGKFPFKRVIEVSYGDDLAQRFGRRNKEKIQEFGKELFNIELSKNSDTDFEIKDYKGSMISKGIMAGLTGNPGDLIIIDDPIKNRQEAESETYRNRIWEEFLNSIYTRLSADGVIVLIMTRWHEDDLAGRLLTNMSDKCLEINIPLEAEENDILGRNTGDSLFPEIGKDGKWLAEFKKAYTTSEGNRSWNALMQGRPTAQEGNMIKKHWWQYWKPKGMDLPPITVKLQDGSIKHIQAIDLPEKFDRQLQSWDMTFKDSEGTDFVAAGTWGSYGADIFYLDQINERMDFPTTLDFVQRFSRKWPKASLKLIEDKANGPAIIAMLKHKMPGILPVQPDGSKIARVSAISEIIESGNVYLPHPQIAPWINEFLSQCSAFPKGAHDDLVDQMSQALKRFMYVQQHEKKYMIPNNLSEDLKHDLESDPKALEHWLRTHQ